jgi:hypothetical protein
MTIRRHNSFRTSWWVIANTLPHSHRWVFTLDLSTARPRYRRCLRLSLSQYLSVRHHHHSSSSILFHQDFTSINISLARSVFWIVYSTYRPNWSWPHPNYHHHCCCLLVFVARLPDLMMIIRTSSSSMMILLILLSTMMIFIQMSDAAINYHCDDNQVLIVQQFGNDTIRMHCQVVNLCGYENLVSFWYRIVFRDLFNLSYQKLIDKYQKYIIFLFLNFALRSSFLISNCRIHSRVILFFATGGQQYSSRQPKFSEKNLTTHFLKY